MTLHWDRNHRQLAQQKVQTVAQWRVISEGSTVKQYNADLEHTAVLPCPWLTTMALTLNTLSTQGAVKIVVACCRCTCTARHSKCNHDHGYSHLKLPPKPPLAEEPS
jgi:hypothetical protein